MLSDQDVRVPLAEVDGVLSGQIDELFVLAPVILGIGVPIHGKLAHIQHGEGLLLLDLVVDVEEGPLESVVRHGVLDALRHQTEVKGLVAPGNTGVLEPNVDVPDGKSEVFPDDILETRQVTITSFSFFDGLSAGRHLLLDLGEELLDLLSLGVQEGLLDELPVVVLTTF